MKFKIRRLLLIQLFEIRYLKLPISSASIDISYPDNRNMIDEIFVRLIKSTISET